MYQDLEKILFFSDLKIFAKFKLFRDKDLNEILFTILIKNVIKICCHQDPDKFLTTIFNHSIIWISKSYQNGRVEMITNGNYIMKYHYSLLKKYLAYAYNKLYYAISKEFIKVLL